MTKTYFFPLLIQEIIKKEGLTINQFAEKAGFSLTAVSNWLGAKFIPDNYSVTRLSEIFPKYKLELLESALFLIKL